MGKKVWFIAFIISFIISIAFNFNYSLEYFLVSSLIIGLIIFALFSLIIKFIQSLKENSPVKRVILLVLIIVSIAIISLGYYIFSLGGVCLTAITPDHFRTNIFTRKCYYGGSAACVASDPWYFKPDCKTEDKIKIMKMIGHYDARLEECKVLCSDNDKAEFCGEIGLYSWGNGPTNIDCEAVISCETIFCD